MKMGRLFSASILMLGAAVALFAGDNPKVTGSFTFLRNPGNPASMQVTAQQTDAELLLGKGSIYYQDAGGVLNLQVQYVKMVDNNTACVASRVAEGTNYPGQEIGWWFVNKFVDKGEPGVQDTVAGSGLQASSLTDVMNVVEKTCSALQTGDITITGGNIQVH